MVEELRRWARQACLPSTHSAEALLKAVEELCGNEGRAVGVLEVLDLCAGAIEADAAVFFRDDGSGQIFTICATRALSGSISAEHVDFPLDRQYQVADLEAAGFPAPFRDMFHGYRALLSAPVIADAGAPMAIVLLARSPAAFSWFDMELLGQVATILSSTIKGGDAGNGDAGPDTRSIFQDPDEQRTTAFPDPVDNSTVGTLSRYADWQARILDITNKLIQSPSDCIDASIAVALSTTGLLAGSDRTFVFRLRAPDRIDNTHEWCADDIEPMIDVLQDMSESLLDEWREDFRRGQAVYIPDVLALPDESAVREVLAMQSIQSLLAVPMLRDGNLTGFVGYDAVRDHRKFSSVEIQLIQSVANAIGVMIDRAAAELAANKARTSLQDERDRLRATLSALPDLVLELGPDGRFLAFNDGAGVFPAFKPETFLGRMPEEVLSPELSASLRATLQELDCKGVASPIEYEMEINGERRWFHTRVASLLFGRSQGGYILSARDITDRQNHRQRIIRLAKVAERTSNLVVVTDAGARVEWVNPAFERRSGWPLEAVRGSDSRSLLIAQDAPLPLLLQIERSFSNGEPKQVEVPVVTRSGEQYWTSVDIQPLRDNNEALIGFVSVATDITGLKQSQQLAVRERAEAMDISSDGIAICAVDGPYSYMNAAHRTMFGIDLDEDVSRLTWHDLYSSDTVNKFMKSAFQQLLRDRTWRGELTGLARDGSLVVQEVTLTFKHDDKLLCIARDKSEEFRVGNEQANLRDQLQIAQRRETVAHITAGVAHDLNNLVAVVSGTATLLQDRAIEDAEITLGINRILRAMDTARDLVSGLGSVARPAKLRTRQDLRDLVGKGVELLGSDRLQLHQVTVSAPNHECPVWANTTDILQVLLNLALNACESGGPGPTIVGIDVRTGPVGLPARKPDIGMFAADADVSVVTVTDTGEGIDPEARVRLFDRYYTTKGEAGTGLGLPIVAAILRHNNAAMWLDSGLGEGTKVSIAWPAYPSKVARSEPRANHSAPLVDLSGHSVLVVDDVEDVADVIADMLEAAGATCISISDPVEAQELLMMNPGTWDVLVTDFHMPLVSGVELAMTAARLNPPVPAILVTALAESVGESREHFAAVLAKPVDAADLVDQVRAAISGG